MKSLRHFPFSLLPASRQITTRLRFGLILIGIVVLGAAFLATLQARTIVNAHIELRDRALPMLALAQHTENDLAAIRTLLGGLETETDDVQRAALEGNLADRSQRVQTHLAALRRLKVPAEDIAKLDERLQTAQTSSAKVIAKHATLSALETEIADTHARIVQLQERSRRILSDLTIQTTSEADARIRSLEDAGTPTPRALNEVFNALLLAPLNISTIEFTLDKITNTALGLHPANPATIPARTRLLIKADMQDIIARLAQLPDTPERWMLAGHIAELRGLLSERNGLFDRFDLRQQFRDDLAISRENHAALTTQVSEISRQLVSHSLERVHESTETLDSAVESLVGSLIGAMILAVGTVTLTNRIVVERQFNRRIHSLTEAVTAIAAGNLRHPITVGGQDELGDVARALVVFRDNAEALSRSNKELEQFAYIAAHDLRAPLRAIQELSDWVQEDTENSLTEESRSYLEMLQNRAMRLSRLLGDLLNYARVGQTEPDVRLVDLEQLVAELAQDADPEGHYNIRYLGPQHPVLAQSTPLEQIIGNLLRNAVKHHDRAEGSILVNADISADSLHLLVVDDGPGIEPQYQNQVFELFKTLRPQDEIDGNGLGLAIVSKLIARSKGKVTVHSDPSKERGATFEVLLPLPPQINIPTIGEPCAKAA